MIKFWLFTRVALLKVRNAKIEQQNKFLTEMLEQTIKDRNDILQKYYDFAEKVCRISR